MGESMIMISRIREKLIQLIELQRKLRIENIELQKNQKVLQEKIELQNKTIEELTEKNKVLIFAKSIKNGDLNSDVKMRIDEMVREIDKCIGLLNK
jgi:FMN-dependent NADH-azoreductase